MINKMAKKTLFELLQDTVFNHNKESDRNISSIFNSPTYRGIFDMAAEILNDVDKERRTTSETIKETSDCNVSNQKVYSSVVDEDNKKVYYLNMLGVKKDSIKATINNKILTVEGEIMDTYFNLLKNDKFIYKMQIDENQYDVENIETTFESGVLGLHIPYINKDEPRKININIQ
jgi:HSP20 family molecular chaperone IbpA